MHIKVAVGQKWQFYSVKMTITKIYKDENTSIDYCSVKFDDGYCCKQWGGLTDDGFTDNNWVKWELIEDPTGTVCTKDCCKKV
jgi:hypothetical protein